MGLFEKRRLSEEEIKAKGILSWPTWEKEVSRFPWAYDETEECYFIEGEVIIETKAGNYTIEPDDFVVFHEGLKCDWDIRRPVKKHYNFS